MKPEAHVPNYDWFSDPTKAAFGRMVSAAYRHDREYNQQGGKSMRVGFKSEHWDDENGNPAGGATFGNGFAISWQNGPLGRDEDRKEPNGAFVEDVIAAAADRIEYYQESKFVCFANAQAMTYLHLALKALNDRTKDREDREVEGTHVE